MERELESTVRVYGHHFNFGKECFKSRKLYEHCINVGPYDAYLAVTDNRFFIVTKAAAHIYETKDMDLIGRYEFQRKSDLYFALVNQHSLLIGTLTPPRAFEIVEWTSKEDQGASNQNTDGMKDLLLESEQNQNVGRNKI